MLWGIFYTKKHHPNYRLVFTHFFFTLYICLSNLTLNGIKIKISGSMSAALKITFVQWSHGACGIINITNMSTSISAKYS